MKFWRDWNYTTEKCDFCDALERFIACGEGWEPRTGCVRYKWQRVIKRACCKHQEDLKKWVIETWKERREYGKTKNS